MNTIKQIKTSLALCILQFLIMICSSKAADWSDWKPYAKLKVDSGFIATLSYRVKYEGSNTLINWRVENDSNNTFYEVSVGDINYKTADGKKLKRTNGYIGKIATTERKALTYSMVSGKIESFSFVKSGEEVVFSLSKDWVDNKKPWSNFGKVTYVE